MADNNEADDSNDSDNSDSDSSNSGAIDFSELSDEQRSALSEQPEVRKMLRYEETAIPQIAGMLRNLSEADGDTESGEAFDLLVSGIAERSGRVTEATVRKVLTNFAAEYDSVK